MDANPNVHAIEAPPIAEAYSWIEGGRHSEQLIDLAQAIPGYPPPASLQSHVASIAHEPTAGRYTEIEGQLPLREALARDINSTYQAALGPDNVLITAGCNQAFYIALTTLAGPGDDVILTTPWYFNHRMTLDILGVGIKQLPCRSENGFLPDPTDLAALVGPKTRALVLTSPNNPTGAVYPPKLLHWFLEECRRLGIALILDETYRDFIPPDQDRPHFLFDDEAWSDTLIHLYSFSKVYSLAGYRVGALATSAGLIQQAAKVMDCLAICAPHIGQRAALFGLENLNQWRASNRALMATRIETFQKSLMVCPSGFEVAAIGAYFAYLRHPFPTTRAIDVARRLAQDFSVLGLPATMFGPLGGLVGEQDQERYLRFAFANVEGDKMAEIAQRLTACTS